MSFRKTWQYKRWRVVFESSQVFPDDPGNGTPAMVYAPGGDSATYNCAADTGECNDTPIPLHIMSWLEKLEEEIEACFERAEEERKLSS